MGKEIRIFGTFYSETDKGKNFVDEFDFVVHLDTELTGGLLKSFIQKKFIEKFLREKFGRDKFKGWQTCEIDENPVAPKKILKDKKDKNNLEIV